MNIKLTNTDYFFIFSVLLLYLCVEISKLREPLSLEQKIQAYRKSTNKDYCAAKKERERIAEEDALNKIKLDKQIYLYQKQHDQKDRIKRLQTLPKLYPHTVLSLNVDNPKFGNGAGTQWNMFDRYNKQKEKERIKRKLEFDTSSDWEFSNVENTQKRITWYPYAGKTNGPITIDGVVQETTYDDRLRNSDDAELEDVIVSKTLANRELAKPIWSDVVDFFPMDLRDWEREEPGAFDPSLYMSKKEKRRYKKQKKKEEKRKRKQERQEQKEAERAERERQNRIKSFFDIRYWRKLLNIK